MAVQTQEEVRELVDFAPEGLLVTSFFLNLDAGEFPSPDLLQTSFNSLIHEAEAKRKETEESLSHEASESLRSDLEKIRDFFGDGDIDRENANGLVIFSCAAQGYWQLVRTDTPLESRVEFAERPWVAPLAAFISHSKPTAILLTDRKVARILTISHGEVKEWTEFEDWGPNFQKQGGWSQMRYQRRVENFAKHHVDHGTDLLLKLLQHYPFDWLILGTEVQVQHEVEESLHPYVKDRLIGHISVRIDADTAEVVEKAGALREQVENDLIDKLVAQVQEYAGAGGRGAIGLDDTLQALNEQKVHILLVEQGTQVGGSVCRQCGLLMTGQRSSCPACNEPVQFVEDIVGQAIQRAFELGSAVEVATEPGKLDAVQKVAAILYY